MKKTLSRLFGRRKKAPSRPLVMADPAVESFLLRMPKVELQVQLECCLRPARVLSLAAKHQLGLPCESEADVRKLLRYKDVKQRHEVYGLLCRTLRDAEDVHLLALDFLAEQAMQNVRYSEVHVDVATLLGHGIDPEGLRQALSEAARDGERRHGIRMRLIASIVRQAGTDAADQVLDWALADPDGLVAGLGLGGRELETAESYGEHFERAAAAGLGRTARAGEEGGSDEVRSVLDACRPERLGRGGRVSEDPQLVAELAERRLPLLMCPGADQRSGLYADAKEHPFSALRQAGVAASVHTDGGPFADTNLTREYVRLHLAFGLTPAELAELAVETVDAAFLPGDEKAALAEEMRRTMPRPA